MADQKIIFKAELDNSDIDKKQDEAKKKSEQTAQGIGNACKAIGTALAGLLASAGALAVKLGKKVVEAYGEFEQLQGGVQTLFGSSWGAVMKNAQEAYKTAGLSANEYMETVTSFSASLLQSLDGDTQKATRYADMAVKDMSDNANKMGTSMESIQNAYQGFAKQNYTMLDNLKLGYGGTKEEMQRLLEDASKISGFKYDISSYADIVDAIHVVQNEMGITGTTAKEASDTIQGSLKTLQGAWANLLTGLGDPKADVKKLAKDVIDSAMQVFRNITPVIKNIIAVLPVAVKMILEALVEMLPEILTTVMGLVESVANLLIEQAPFVISTLVEALKTAFPMIIQMLFSLLDMIFSILPDLIRSLGQAIIDNFPILMQGIVNLITMLAKQLPLIIQAIIDILPDLIITIVTEICNNLPLIIDGIVLLIAGIIEKLPDLIMAIIKILPRLIVMIAKSLVECTGHILKALWEIGASVMDALENFFVQLGLWIANGAKSIFNKYSNAVKEGWGIFVAWLKGVVTNIVTSIKNWFNGIVDAGRQLVQGLWNGIKNGWDWLVNKVKELANKLINGVKQVLGIHSPSTVFKVIGKFVDEGLSEGIEGYERLPRDATKHMLSGITTGISIPDLSAVNSLGMAMHQQAVNVQGSWTGTMEADGYSIAKVVLRNLDDACAFTLRG